MNLQESWQHQYITSNGIQLHYVTQGDGPLMLMLHGFPEFWYSWRHQIREFAKDYKVGDLSSMPYQALGFGVQQIPSTGKLLHEQV